MTSRTLLLVIVRLTAAAMLCALLFVFVPYGWLAEVHEMVGMGPLEYSALTSYLARTLSALYAILGGLLLAMSTDVRRYRPLLILFGWIAFAGGIAVTAFDAVLRLPLFWTVLEGPATALMGLAVAILARQVADSR